MIDPQIITAIKRVFSRSKFARDFKEKHIIKNKKGKRGGKVVRCNVCMGYIPMYKSQIDHINPIVPVMIPAKIMSFIFLYNRTFCNESNLQIICPECHKNKGKGELAERVKWRKKKKYLVVRSLIGSKIDVITITNTKEFPKDKEVMNCFNTEKKATVFAKKLKNT
jgi:5-methylcytosine-specific restriction endonuclease McrA